MCPSCEKSQCQAQAPPHLCLVTASQLCPTLSNLALWDFRVSSRLSLSRCAEQLLRGSDSNSSPPLPARSSFLVWLSRCCYVSGSSSVQSSRRDFSQPHSHFWLSPIVWERLLFTQKSEGVPQLCLLSASSPGMSTKNVSSHC